MYRLTNGLLKNLFNNVPTSSAAPFLSIKPRMRVGFGGMSPRAMILHKNQACFSDEVISQRDGIIKAEAVAAGEINPQRLYISAGKTFQIVCV